MRQILSFSEDHGSGFVSRQPFSFGFGRTSSSVNPQVIPDNIGLEAVRDCAVLPAASDVNWYVVVLR
jgi:hypothetical protein